MDQHAQNTTVAQNVAQLRKARGLSQTELADAAAISYSLLQKIEQDTRPATPAVVASLARALGVGAARLNGQPYDQEGDHRDPVHAAIPAVRSALTYWDVPPRLEVPPRGLDELRADVATIERLRRLGRYTEMSRILPGLLQETTLAAHTLAGHDREVAFELLSILYFCTHTIAFKIGYEDLATLVEERFRWSARESQDPFMVAFSEWTRTQSLLDNGSYDVGLTILERVRHDLDGELGAADRDAWALYGSLHLRSAVLASRAGDADTAYDHIGAARDIAQHHTPDEVVTSRYQVTFGAANVAIHDVAVSVELSDDGRALDRAQALHIPPTLPPIRTGHHFVDLSRALLWRNDISGAVDALRRAREIAPQQTRHHPTTHAVTQALVHAHRRSNERLTELAHWVGIDL